MEIYNLVLINNETCVGCKACIPICPVSALTIIEGKARVDLEQCVECGVCVRSDVCPFEALSMSASLDEIREVRHYLSDPTTTKKLTGVPGRGTEEVKTNDVTGRIKRGYVGFCIELGRPGVGTTFREVEKVSTALSRLGVQFEEQNPVTALFVDESGRLNENMLDERVLSAIVEVKIEMVKIPDVIQALSILEKELETVFSLGIICRFDENGDVPALKIIKASGVKIRENAKINVGLGRPLSEA